MKYRPKCAFSECLVGYRWFESTGSEPFVISEANFLAGNYPKDTPKDSFKEKTIPVEIWDQLEKDLSEENQL